MLWLMVALLIVGISIFSSWTMTNVVIVGVIVLAGLISVYADDVERRHEETLDALDKLNGRDRWQEEIDADERRSGI